MQPLPPIPDPRPLAAEERRLARWMLEHGAPEAREFLPQLPRARVVSRCACGCATIDLEVGGLTARRDGGMRVLGDFWFGDGDGVGGVFIYHYGGVLSGIEVYALSGDTPRRLPTPESLRPMDEAGE
ncbi:MAG TPA: hypothetical protein VHG93_19060 [Longimicrobium sp.]|nr:hypothetical protein [Longimicrobium sp.]